MQTKYRLDRQIVFANISAKTNTYLLDKTFDNHYSWFSRFEYTFTINFIFFMK